MDYLHPVLKRELDLLTLIVNFAFKKGWITETEKLKITTKATLDLKKSAFFDILRNTKCDKNAARLFWSLRSVDEMKLDPTPNSNALSEHSCLSIIMSKLCAMGLVTEQEKLIYENSLLNAKENDFQKGKLDHSQIEKGIMAQDGFNEPQSAINKSNPIQNGTNPMLINLVVKCVLQYLNFEEVKNARYISEVWGIVGLSVLKTRSKIEFSQRVLSDSTDRTPLNFFSIFPNEALETGPFTKYKFYGHDRTIMWTIEELNYFFGNQKNNIKELEFNGMNLVDEKSQRCIECDISSWLMNSAMTKSNTKWNTRLDVTVRGNTYNNDSTPIFLQLSALLNIKELRLMECNVHLQEGILISPGKLEIDGVDFHENGNKMTQICVNDIVDFSKAKEITLTNNNVHETSKMFLDMGQNADIKLESLSLDHITLKNLETCRWNVNQLNLDYMSFTESSSRMEVKELTAFASQVDISLLPPSIEKLLMYSCRRSNYLCNQPIILHNLKTMKVDFRGSRDSEILGFLHSRILTCPVLVELHLENNSKGELLSIRKIKVTLIPRTIKILKISGICIEDDGSNILNLDNLVLSQYRICNLEEICGNLIQTTNLVVSFPVDIMFNVDGFLNSLNSQNICRGTDHRIYAGRFYWTTYFEYTFEESSLSDYVDKEAEYYVFENKVGKAIKFEEFHRMMANNFD